MGTTRNIIKFKAGGLVVVLEFGEPDELEKYKNRIETAGLKYECLPAFHPKFDQADLFMDMRSPECAAQFNLDDWL